MYNAMDNCPFARIVRKGEEMPGCRSGVEGSGLEGNDSFDSFAPHVR